MVAGDAQCWWGTGNVITWDLQQRQPASLKLTGHKSSVRVLLDVPALGGSAPLLPLSPPFPLPSSPERLTRQPILQWELLPPTFRSHPLPTSSEADCI